MSADGVPLAHLEVGEDGRAMLPTDTFSAMRVLLAALDHDDTAMFEILRDRPALPLLGGLLALAAALGDAAYGDKLREHVDLLALVQPDDPYGQVEAYRQSRRPA
jgi:hypothetical protein